MNQFIVPQFIDTEDKILGPVTSRQFVIMMFSCIVAALFYKLFDFSLFVFSAVMDLGICAIFAFVKVNGRPFHYFILNLIQSFKKPRLRIWHNFFSKTGDEEEVEIKIEKEKKEAAPVKDMSASRLAQLALAVDTMGVYSGEVRNYETRVSRELEKEVDLK